MYNFGYVIGIIVGVLVGVGIFALIVRYTRGSWGITKSKYDERQRIAMGKAYRDGFYVILAGVLLVGALARIPEIEAISSMLYTTVAFLGVEVFAIGCILRDAYMGLNDNAKKWTLCFLLIAAANILPAINIYQEDGLAGAWLNILCVFLLISSIAVYWTRAFLRKSDIDECEEDEEASVGSPDSDRL